ncbi:hypothetical protein GF108_16275 [Phyllobacterium sp. SYP-B3895]|uniref:hypothetical protein n=1 Tax=Phyllobacterium sp. SYP-B3895 TaxID=2663240 RepID=UPI001299E7C6|nr:hypothetical protein [Phyllobacterium sp. SYP-B3895]MRG57135.1 hypothetical protein [Phyllobacterium sp. SYP-B3895]
MAIAFDTLGYSKRLRAGGIDQQHAETHAEAARDYIMSELVTKADLAAAVNAINLTLTLRLGAMLALGFGILATLMKLI